MTLTTCEGAMPTNLSIYAWRDNSLGGFIGIGTKDNPVMHHRHCCLDFNEHAVHFNAVASPVTADYMKQITAIAQIGTMVASSKDFRERCMQDVSVVEEVATIIPVKVI